MIQFRSFSFGIPLLLSGSFLSSSVLAFSPSTVRRTSFDSDVRCSFACSFRQSSLREPFLRVRSSTRLFSSNDPDEDETNAEPTTDESSSSTFNPYADPNYPDLEFVNYDDPEYVVDQGIGDDVVAPNEYDSTEQEIEAMREERRRKNDEYQFQTYFKEILKEGDQYIGEWTIYKSSHFVDGIPPVDEKTSGPSLPKLFQAGEPVKVVSRAFKRIVDDASSTFKYPVDKERILHEETLLVDPEIETKRQALETESSDTVAEMIQKELVSQTYGPEEIKAFDFRGHQGNQCVGAAYTLSWADPIAPEGSEPHLGPFTEYRTELGLQYDDIRYRIKLNYATLPDSPMNERQEHPSLHLKTMAVCRENRSDWPFDGKNGNSLAVEAVREALFGTPGAPGGLFDPPPVGGPDQAVRYMLLDLPGRATVLFPHMMEQDDTSFDGSGWVFSLDWTPGRFRYQVDRKVTGGTKLLGLRTLELSEVQSADADEFRPSKGPEDMRQ